MQNEPNSFRRTLILSPYLADKYGKNAVSANPKNEPKRTQFLSAGRHLPLPFSSKTQRNLRNQRRRILLFLQNKANLPTPEMHLSPLPARPYQKTTFL
jgi:hypothetical protein